MSNQSQDTNGTGDGGAGAAMTGDAGGLVTGLDADKLARAQGLARDPSNTYEHGLPGGANPDRAVPDGAKLITTHADAQEAGYYGYAPGAANDLTLAAAGARNQRLAEARQAVVNRSAADEDGHTALKGKGK
jgi:hypothetical protein